MFTDYKHSALLGKAGEDYVAKYLKSKGFIILKRNWRDSRYGEIDIIAENRDYIVFVEVKTRQNILLLAVSKRLIFINSKELKMHHRFLCENFVLICHLELMLPRLRC